MTENTKLQDSKEVGSHRAQQEVSVESILCTEELRRRPSRPPDFEKETNALVALSDALADPAAAPEIRGVGLNRCSAWTHATRSRRRAAASSRPRCRTQVRSTARWPESKAGERTWPSPLCDPSSCPLSRLVPKPTPRIVRRTSEPNR